MFCEFYITEQLLHYHYYRGANVKSNFLCPHWVECKFVHPTEAITMRHHYRVCLTLSIHSISKPKQWLSAARDVRRYGCARGCVCGACPPLIARYMAGAAWQGLFNSTPTIITVNSTGTQPFSTITHTNGTACNISSLRKPFPLPRAPSPTQNYHSTFPPRLTESATLPLHVSPSSLSLSLRLFVGEKRPPTVVPLEFWVGEKYRLRPDLFPFSLAVFTLRLSFPSSTSDIRGLTKCPR